MYVTLYCLDFIILVIKRNKECLGKPVSASVIFAMMTLKKHDFDVLNALAGAQFDILCILYKHPTCYSY